MRTIVLVEGVTDELALTLAARRHGRDLKSEGVSVVPINGAHAIGGFLRRLAVEEPGAMLAGLYDEGEEEVVRAALEQTGYGPNLDRSQLEKVGFFACVADLEEELIRAAGESHLAKLIELEGDAQPWHAFQNQPAWTGRPVDQQLRPSSGACRSETADISGPSSRRSNRAPSPLATAAGLRRAAEISIAANVLRSRHGPLRNRKAVHIHRLQLASI